MSPNNNASQICAEILMEFVVSVLSVSPVSHGGILRLRLDSSLISENIKNRLVNNYIERNVHTDAAFKRSFLPAADESLISA